MTERPPSIASTTASVLDAEGMLGGIASPLSKASTTAGNDGYVVIAHVLDVSSPVMELVVFHLDPASHWNLVATGPSVVSE